MMTVLCFIPQMWGHHLSLEPCRIPGVKLAICPATRACLCSFLRATQGSDVAASNPLALPGEGAIQAIPELREGDDSLTGRDASS